MPLIVISGLRADFANITWPVNANMTLPITLEMIISCSGGIPTNLLILYISFCSPLVKGEYKYFLANLAIFDLIYCLTTVAEFIQHMYYLLTDTPMDVDRCAYQAGPTWLAGYFLLSALPLASINRYFVIVKKKNTIWFTRRRIILLCLSTLFPFSNPIVELCFGRYITTYNRCNYRPYFPYLGELIVILTVIYAYGTLIYCNYRIYKELSTNIGSVRLVRRKSDRQIKNERSLLKALVFQAVIPLIGGTAMFCALVIVKIDGWANENNGRLFANLALTWMDFAQLLYHLNPFLDAMVTLVVVKQYRASVSAIFARIRGKVGVENTSTTHLIRTNNLVENVM